jgi:MFS family permease
MASFASSRPKGLGSAYAKLWSAGLVSFVGDGIYYTALPLLAATLTRDPLAVASVEVAAQLPWLLFALHAGALVDRWDRRRVLWATDAYRSLVVLALAVAVLAGVGQHPAAHGGRVPAGRRRHPVHPGFDVDHSGDRVPGAGAAGAGQRPHGRRPDRR